MRQSMNPLQRGSMGGQMGAQAGNADLAGAQSTDATQTNVEAFLSSVFTYMAAALGISGGLAYWFGTSPQLLSLIINLEAGGLTGLGWIVTLSPLAFVLIMNFGMQKLSATSLMLLFIAFAGCMGMSLSTIFVTFTAGSIYKTFGVTAITFGVMAMIGYTTKTDLTKMGKILMMALVGIIIAMVVNWFLASPMMDFLISIGGVVVFTGLTAYETQQLKRIGSGVEYGSESANKLALMGAMSLYLTFINLFLFLLRLMGGGRD